MSLQTFGNHKTNHTKIWTARKNLWVPLWLDSAPYHWEWLGTELTISYFIFLLTSDSRPVMQKHRAANWKVLSLFHRGNDYSEGRVPTVGHLTAWFLCSTCIRWEAFGEHHGSFQACTIVYTGYWVVLSGKDCMCLDLIPPLARADTKTHELGMFPSRRR